MNPFRITSCNTDTPLAQVEALGRQLAHHPQRPDGIIGAATTSTFALSAGLQHEGLRIGVDFDAASKHSSNLMNIAMPDIISIPEDFHLAGYRAAQLLMQAIDGVAAEQLQEVITLR